MRATIFVRKVANSHSGYSVLDAGLLRPVEPGEPVNVHVPPSPVGVVDDVCILVVGGFRPYFLPLAGKLIVEPANLRGQVVVFAGCKSCFDFRRLFLLFQADSLSIR